MKNDIYNILFVTLIGFIAMYMGWISEDRVFAILWLVAYIVAKVIQLILLVKLVRGILRR